MAVEVIELMVFYGQNQTSAKLFSSRVPVKISYNLVKKPEGLAEEHILLVDSGWMLTTHHV